MNDDKQQAGPDVTFAISRPIAAQCVVSGSPRGHSGHEYLRPRRNGRSTGDGAGPEVHARIMQRLEGRIDAVEERLKTYISGECEKVETKLLAEFHKWGSTADMRTRQTMEASFIVNAGS